MGGTIAVPGQTLSWRRAWLPPEPTRSVPWYGERTARGATQGNSSRKSDALRALWQVSLGSLPWTTMRTATVQLRPGCLLWRGPAAVAAAARIAEAPRGEVRPLSGADEGFDATTGYGALRSASPSAVLCLRTGQVCARRNTGPGACVVSMTSDIGQGEERSGRGSRGQGRK
jgi:hypothetical protein